MRSCVVSVGCGFPGGVGARWVFLDEGGNGGVGDLAGGLGGRSGGGPPAPPSPGLSPGGAGFVRHRAASSAWSAAKEGVGLIGHGVGGIAGGRILRVGAGKLSCMGLLRGG